MPRSKIKSEEERTLTSILSLCGLSEKESKLYWVLVNHGTLNGADLINKSGYKKGNTYALIRQLQKKGLVTELVKEKKTYFQPEPPQKILDLLTGKLQQVEQAKQFIDNILPSLSSRYKLGVGKPVVRYYEGEKGIRHVFQEIYNSFNKVVWGCLDPSLLTQNMWNHILGSLMPVRIRNKVFAHSIHPEKKEIIMMEDKKNLKKVYYIDPEKYPLPSEVDVWDDKVSFISFKEKELIGTIIENQDFATTIQSLFKLCLDLLQDKQFTKK